MSRTVNGLPGVYNSSGITLNDGEGSALALDSSGRVLITLATDSIVLETGGVYNATPPTLTDTQQGEYQLDINGNQKETLATTIAGEDIAVDVLKVEHRYSYLNITTQTTTVVKSGDGFLHSLDFTAVGTGVITLYDNTAGSGTKIRTITSPTVLLQNEVNKILDVSFTTGLTIVTATASQDIMVGYR